MPLIDQTSDLTSLKYGSDRRGGGWSGQPYFTKDIPDRARSINFANSFLGNDFLIRGGVRSISAVLEDEIRLGKFFSSLKSPNGLLFIAKQNLLSRQAPLTGAAPDRLYLPTSTLAQAGVNPIGLHFTKQGKKLNLDDGEKYFKKTQLEYNSKDTNKLLLLFDTNLITPKDDFSASPNALNNALNIANLTGDFSAFDAALANEASDAKNASAQKTKLGKFGISQDPLLLFQYQGGPNALPGQKTAIRRVFNTNEGIDYNKTQLTNQFLVYTQDLITELPRTTSTTFGSSGIVNFESKFLTKDAQTATGVNAKRVKELIGKPTDYKRFNRSTTYGEGDPGSTTLTSGETRDRSAYYTTDLRKGNNKLSDLKKIYSYDEVNAQPLYSSADKTAKKTTGFNDMIKFNIGVVNLNDSSITTWVHLRSYITSFSDSYTSDWQSFTYMGRGNNFYKYKGYNRSVSLGFEVVVHSKYEQAFVYDKLNYLASLTAPNYSDGGFMRGNILKLTVGDYLNNTYGILNSINFDIPNDSPWDIGRTIDGKEDPNSLQLPQRITVSNFAFTPIHDFRDEVVSKNYVDGIDQLPNSRFISLGEGGKGYEFTENARSTNLRKEQ